MGGRGERGWVAWERQGTVEGQLSRHETGTQESLVSKLDRGGRQKPASLCLNQVFLAFERIVPNF